MSARIVVVGGGLAAVRVAQELRDLGHSGPLVILSDEPETPYDRPALSKGFLAGTISDADLSLMAGATLDVDLRLGQRVVDLDRASRHVVLQDGTRVGYDQLVVATGSAPRPLPALAGLRPVMTFRTAADARRLAVVLAPGRSIVLVGGGFVGLEIASGAIVRGCAVTVVEAQAEPLLAALGVPLASWLRGYHERHGVQFRRGTTVITAAESSSGGVQVALSDGSDLRADMVVVGIGVHRDVAWLARAGLETAPATAGGGLICDESGRSSDPDVFGAGDVVSRRRGETHTPIGHWTAAGASARATAHGLLGRSLPPGSEGGDDGYFWSNQYDLRLQSIGSPAPGSTCTVVVGDLDDHSFVAEYRMPDGQVSGIVAVNRPRDFLRARRAWQAPVVAGAEVSS